MVFEMDMSTFHIDKRLITISSVSLKSLYTSERIAVFGEFGIYTEIEMHDSQKMFIF